VPSTSAADSYNWWAGAYDASNPENDYETWLGEVLLPRLEEHGLKRGWALDIGCGTGLAFPPLLNRNWKVVGCDASGGMLEASGKKFGSAVCLLELDARELPSITAELDQPDQEGFDLVLMLNDVINYLTDDGDLQRAFTGIKKNLSPHGLALLDANTVALFQRDYEQGVSSSLGSTGWRWRGNTQHCGPEQIYEAELQDPSGSTRIHKQRHWSQQQIEHALTGSGLECKTILGQREDSGEIQLSGPPSETQHQKILYFMSHI